MKKLLSAVFLSAGLVWASMAGEATWLTDFAKAQAQAKKENKLLFMDFTGSDWCPPCKALHKNVLTSETFTKFADKHLVLLMVDFPRTKPQNNEQKKANKELAKQFAIEGYPTVIVLDKDGKQLKKKVGYSGKSAAEFVSDLEKLVAKK